MIIVNKPVLNRVVTAHLRYRASLLATTALVATVMATGPADAGDSTWSSLPANSDYNNGSNWSNFSVPNHGTAFFGTSATTNLTFSFSYDTAFNGWTFNEGAPAYTFTIQSAYHQAAPYLQFTGVGLVNAAAATLISSGAAEVDFKNASSAGSATLITGYSDVTSGGATFSESGSIYFKNTSTAASAHINNGGALEFDDSSTADHAIITNQSALYFKNLSTAANAQITNTSLLEFDDSSTAGQAIITNNGGQVSFTGNSTGGNAQIINNGFSAEIDFFNTSGPNGDGKLSVGSLAGDGSFHLGNNQLTVGSNNLIPRCLGESTEAAL